METSKCNKCGEEKLKSEFSPDKRYIKGIQGICKACVRTWMKSHRSTNHNQIYANKYKTDISEIERVLSNTNCEICGKESPTNKRHAIDHCHVTGKIRGLLCEDCNLGLGRFKDSELYLNKAILYLKKYGE